MWSTFFLIFLGGERQFSSFFKRNASVGREMLLVSFTITRDDYVKVTMVLKFWSNELITCAEWSVSSLPAAPNDLPNSQLWFRALWLNFEALGRILCVCIATSLHTPSSKGSYISFVNDTVNISNHIILRGQQCSTVIKKMTSGRWY